MSFCLYNKTLWAPGSVYLGVVVLSICEVCHVHEGYVGSAAALHT